MQSNSLTAVENFLLRFSLADTR